MDCFIISTNSSITALEVDELIGKSCEVTGNVCVVQEVSPTNLATLCYRCQSALHICILLGRGSDPESITYSGTSWFEGKTFGVLHLKGKEFKTPSNDIAGTIGAKLVEETKSKVQLKNPDIKVISYNEEEFFVGIDLCEVELSKRPYKLASHAGSLNGVFAYSLLRLAGMKKDSIVVDPFCGSGTIVIEAALFAQENSAFKFTKKLAGAKLFPEEFEKVVESLKAPRKADKIFGFDSQVKVMLQAQKNAKVAGIHESLTISKVALDWIDAKFDENTVDLIVTNPPKINKRAKNDKQINKLYDDLFYQAKYILKKGAILGILLVQAGSIEEIANKHHFTLKKEQQVHSGKQEYVFLQFQAP